MKTIKFITFLAIICIFQVYSVSGEKDLLKELKLSDKTCDLCGCYLGFQGNYNKNYIGVRYRFREFRQDAVSTTSALTDHAVDPGVESKEYYNTMELYGRYYLNPKFQIMISMPYGFNNIDGDKFNGIGDIIILSQYKIAAPSTLLNSSAIKSTVFVGTGVKLPTGSYNQKSSDGDIEPHFQTGTGSTDFIFSGTYIGKYKSFGFTADAVYRIGTYNSNNYKFANRINFSSTIFYEKFFNAKTELLPNAGFYFESSKQDNMSRTELEESSGGTVLFASLGADMYINHISISAAYQHPVYQNLYGSQPQNKRRVVFGLGYLF